MRPWWVVAPTLLLLALGWIFLPSLLEYRDTAGKPAPTGAAKQDIGTGYLYGMSPQAVCPRIGSKRSCQRSLGHNATRLSVLLENEEFNQIPIVPIVDSPKLPRLFDIRQYVSEDGGILRRGVLPWKQGKPEDIHKKIIVVRTVSMPYYPLEGIERARKNIEFVLDYQSMPNRLVLKNPLPRYVSSIEFDSLWVVNRYINASEVQLILNMLQLNDQLIYQVPLSLPILSRVADPITYLRNSNGVRHTAFREAVAVGARWVVILNSSAFLTDEAWRMLTAAILMAERSSKRYLVFPSFQLVLPQELVLTQPFNLANRWADVQVALPQIAVRYDVPLLFHLENTRYDLVRPADILKELVGKRAEETYCANFTKSDASGNIHFEDPLSAFSCGYAIHLSAHSKFGDEDLGADKMKQLMHRADEVLSGHVRSVLKAQ